MECCAPAAETNACFSVVDDVAMTGRAGVRRCDSTCDEKGGGECTCCTGSLARLQHQRACASSCCMHQNHITRFDGINVPREDHSCEALQQRSTCRLQGHRVWNLDATGTRHRHKLSVGGVAGGETGHTVSVAEAAA